MSALDNSQFCITKCIFDELPEVRGIQQEPLSHAAVPTNLIHISMMGHKVPVGDPDGSKPVGCQLLNHLFLQSLLVYLTQFLNITLLV